MPELRIILLVVGVLFVAGIAGFEWWRSRGQRPAFAARSPARPDTSGLVDDDGAETSRGEAARIEAPRAGRGERADIRALPEINVVREPRMELRDSLPVIELESTSASGTRRALGISISDEVAVDVLADTDAQAGSDVEAVESQPQPLGRAGSPSLSQMDSAACGEAEPQSIGHAEPYIGPDGVSAVRIVPDTVPTVGAPKLQLSWPSEAERRIVTLRVMPKSEPRFAGRALRQAFSGCGFWHGPLDIYHLPDEEGRVVLSAAALAQPGTFDPSIMDSQRFSGLNLFAVLPGPLPERDTFEELVHAARQLADRLGGQIADQHGDELTAERIARLRQSLQAAPAAQAGQA